MARTRTPRVSSSGRWPCPRCYTVNAPVAQFCSDCGLAPRGGRVMALPTPAEASRRRYLEIVPFIVFAVVAVVLLGLQLAH